MPVAIKGSGGGSVTLDAGAAAADTTLTLPNSTGTVINTAPGTNGNVLTSNGTNWTSAAPSASTSIANGTSNVSISSSNGSVTMQTAGTSAITVDTSQNLKFNSGYGSVATAYGCRAWANFNGTGTVAIRASGNVSSITDNSTGNYTVNFTTAMPDANFAANVSINNVSGGSSLVQPYIVTPSVAGSVQIITLQDSGASPADTEATLVSIFR